MPLEPVLLNIDVNFTCKPELVGNQYVVEDFVGSSNIKTLIRPYIDVQQVIEKLKFKHKINGQITNSTNQILTFHQRLIDRGVVEPKKFTFIHIGAHNNLYSYGGHSEYEYKKEIHDYESYQAFAYFFVKKFIDKMIWVVPDHYTEEQIDKHFAGMDFIKRNGYHLVSINQGLRFVVQVVKWSNFLPSKYEWKAATIVTNKHTANFKPADLQKLRELIF